MKNLISTTIFGLLLFISVNAQTFDWVNTIQTFKYSRDFDIKSGPGGSIYHAGSFEDSIRFNFNIGANQVLNNNNYGSYILKKNSQGVVSWFKYLQAIITDFSVDKNGNSYLFVYYDVDFDANPGVGVHMLTSAANLALGNLTSHAVIKLDANGNFIWAKSIVSQGLSDAKMTGDSEGGLYFTGDNYGKIDLDPSPSNIFTVPLQAKAVVFKWDENGNFKWGGYMMSNIDFFSISTNKNRIIFTGYFSGIVDFNIDTNVTVLRNSNLSDHFILSYDTSGVFKWVRNYSRISTGDLNNSFIDSDLNSYFAGQLKFQTDFDFGPGQAILTPTMGLNAFLLKLDSNGVYNWVRHIAQQSPGSSIYNFSITGDHFNNIYLTGTSNGIFNVTHNTPTINLINTNNENRVVTVKYGTNGDYRDYWKFGGNIPIRNAFIGERNSLLYLGVFSDTVNFNPSGISQTRASDSSLSSRFILRLNQCFETNSQISAQSCGAYSSPSGKYAWNTTGNYFDTIPNHMGCDSVIDVNLTVTNTDTSLFLLGTSLASNEFSASFQWLDCAANYAAIPNQTAQLFTPTQNGNYALELTKNGCVDTTSCFNYTLVGQEEHSLESPIKVFPNPFKRQFNLLMSSPYERITVSDLSGRVVWSQNESSNLSTTIDLSSYENGIYFLEVINKGERTVEKLIKH